MPFKTKLDYSDNRQIKQFTRTMTKLSGGTEFGITYTGLTSGPDMTSIISTTVATNVISTYSGNTSETTFVFGSSPMVSGETFISAFTPSTSSTTQSIMSTLVPNNTTTIDGNTVVLDYVGVRYDITPITMYSAFGPTYTGSAYTNTIEYITAGTLDFTGRTIWSDVKGISRTEKLIVTDNPTPGYVLTCANSEGLVQFAPSSGGTSTNTYVTGSSLSGETLILTRNDSINITQDLSSIVGSGSSVNYWTAGTGTDSIITIINSQSLGQATGAYSVSEGYNTIASGGYSHAEGYGNLASGYASHAEGASGNTASGYASHAEGGIHKASPVSFGPNIASGTSSHAEGVYTKAGGNYSHAEGFETTASGVCSHAEGRCTTASGYYSHSEGDNTTASGNHSHSGGYNTIVNGDYSFGHSKGTPSNPVVIDSNNSGILGGINGYLGLTADNSIILGGVGLSGYSADTVYVPSLNLDTLATTSGGDVEIGIDSNGFVTQFASDKSLKENIELIESPLTKVLNLSGVTFDWKNSGINDIGFIAQDVEKVIPVLISKMYKSDLKTVKYKNMTALLVEAIKEMYNDGTYDRRFTSTESILAEDNNIDLNFNGTHDTAFSGGVRVIDGISENENSELLIDENGTWIVKPGLSTKRLINVNEYTPTTSSDEYGLIGETVWDNDYIYIKTNNGWKRTKLETF